MLNEAMFPDFKWAVKHIRTLTSLYGYQDGGLNKYWITWLEQHFLNVERSGLGFSTLCNNMIQDILNYLGWDGAYHVASLEPELADTVGMEASTRMLELTLRLCGTTYLCGEVAAKEYLNHEAFLRSNVSVQIQNWKPSLYSQKTEKFYPNVSIFDGLVMVPRNELVQMLKER